MKDYVFKFGKYPELHKKKYEGLSLEEIRYYANQGVNLLKYEGVSVEALFYDAYKGVNLSLVYLFVFYRKYENRMSEDVLAPIKEFFLKRMELLVYGKITHDQLLNPLGGKTYKRLYPNNERSALVHNVQDIKSWTNLGNEKALELVKTKVGFKAYEADKTILNKRKTRLKKVEKLLRKFYTRKDCKIIDFTSEIKNYIDVNHFSQYQLDAIKELKDIYKRVNKLP